jgi:diguanylate cyclase (GGDEF)-like protein/PAS domain S-box-containing protein
MITPSSEAIMNIDIATIALILVISSIFQAVIVFFQSSKYPGTYIFGIGCAVFALGFLFVMLQNSYHNTFVTVVLGNLLLLLALIFQAVGLIRFLDMRENKWFFAGVFVLCFLLLSYFLFAYNAICYRIFFMYLSIGAISFLSAHKIKGHKIISLSPQVRFFIFLFMLLGLFAVFRSFYALYSSPKENALSPELLQIVSFTGAFILNFVITFTFIFMINKRLRFEINAARDQFELIFNLNPDATLITALPDGNVINFNLGFLNFSGFKKEEVENKRLLDLDIFETRDDRERIVAAITANQFVEDFELNFRHRDKSLRICSISAQLINLNNTPHILSIIRDITDRKNAELALKKSEEKYRFLTEFASDVIWVFNVAKNIYTYISPSIIHLRGLTPEEAMAEKLEDAMTPDSLKKVQTALKDHIKTFTDNPEATNTYLIELQQYHKNGDIIWVEVSTKYRYHASGDIEIVGVSRNIDKRKRAEEKVLYLSYHDQLTGLYNRRFYEEELLRLDTQRNFPIAIIISDINGLKLINDAYGHQMGDTILKSYAEILKTECRHDEIVSRIGGDEFVILLSHTNRENVEGIISRLNDAIASVHTDHTILSVSMGYAIKENADQEINDLFKLAEDAMYRHKLSISPRVKKATIDSIINSINEKNHQEIVHSQTVSEYCEAIGREMKFSSDAVNQLRMAGLRHDIGEIAIDDAILNKPEKLTPAEWAEIRRHPEIGYHILRSVNELAEIARFVLEHHERWDGTGYPKGLKAEEISLQGRIIAVADAYSTMTSPRPYAPALTQAEAVAEIINCADSQFDRNIARLFVEKVLKADWPET